MVKVGARVGAMLSADEKQVQLLGYGVYEGNFVPDDNAGGMAEAVRSNQLPNPRIKLDSGKVVWGCECWWGSEESIKKKCEGREVVPVDIDEVRAGAL